MIAIPSMRMIMFLMRKILMYPSITTSSPLDIYDPTKRDIFYAKIKDILINDSNPANENDNVFDASNIDVAIDYHFPSFRYLRSYKT